jgi:hypothetical protein
VFREGFNPGSCDFFEFIFQAFQQLVQLAVYRRIRYHPLSAVRAAGDFALRLSTFRGFEMLFGRGHHFDFFLALENGINRNVEKTIF